MAWNSKDMLIDALMSAVADGLVAGFEGMSAADAAAFHTRFTNTFSAGLRKGGMPQEVSIRCYRTIVNNTTEPHDGVAVRRVKGTLPDREKPDVR